MKYEVTFPDGTRQTYKTVAEAQNALTQAGGTGGTFKAVAA